MMKIGANRQITPQYGLVSATRLHEAGITSNRGSACHGEYVPEPCTPRPSRSGSLKGPKTFTDYKSQKRNPLSMKAQVFARYNQRV